MKKEDKLILGTLAGVDLILSPEHYEEYKGTLNKQLEEANEENKRLNNIINELERRFNQELELNNKWEVEDTQKFYSKKWYRDVLRDFKNMIKELKENK